MLWNQGTKYDDFCITLSKIIIISLYRTCIGVYAICWSECNGQSSWPKYLIYITLLYMTSHDLKFKYTIQHTEKKMPAWMSSYFGELVFEICKLHFALLFDGWIGCFSCAENISHARLTLRYRLLTFVPNAIKYSWRTFTKCDARISQISRVTRRDLTKCALRDWGELHGG